MSYPGHIQKGMVVLDQPVPLPDGTPVIVEPVARSAGTFWHSCSLEQLARQQGVSAPAAVEELLGGWPSEEREDEFDQAFRAWRDRERDQRA